jgi:hypothetical protein
MSSEKGNRSKWTGPWIYAFAFVLALPLFGGNAWAQAAASITGQVKDPSGAVIVGATVTVKDTDTGLTRSVMSNESGNYLILPLPVGSYEVSAEKSGFKKSLQRGISLVVAGQAVVNVTLEVGDVNQQVMVEAESLLVNTTLSPTADLVTQQQVKDLPLNGRDWAGLLTLNPGVNNTNATQNTSSATRGSPTFSVAGRRFEENRFLMNGIDYVGSDMQGENPQPFGASGKLLGVDGIREFNLVTDTYGAEYGKRAGGQILIVTTAGTNSLHGDVFEFLRNNALDARNFFDPAYNQALTQQIGAPPFKLNQFGGSLGAPLKKDKLFIFGNYEAYREREAVTTNPNVPDNIVRTTGAIPDPCTGVYAQPTGFKSGMLPIIQSYWVPPNSSSVEHTHVATCASNLGAVIPDGVVSVPGNTPQRVNEDFGMARFDYNISAIDTFNTNVLVDDGQSTLAAKNPVSSVIIPQRAELFSMQETHIFSPNLVNVANVGFSRAWQAQANVPNTPFPAAADFAKGGALGSGYPGKLTVGASTSVNSGTNVVTGTINALTTTQHRNYTTGSDDLHYGRGQHSFSFGVWAQRVANNYNGGSPAAQVAYSAGSAAQGLLFNLVTDNPKRFTDTPNPTALGGRTTEAAFYVQDEIKIRPNLSIRLGVRDEMTSGFNEQNCRFSTYYSLNGIPQTVPVAGCSALLSNKAFALWEPRVGVAWDPTGKGNWSIRAGAGTYRDLQDSLVGYMVGLYPFNASFLISKGTGIPGGILGCSTTPGASNFCPGAASSSAPIIPFDVTANAVSAAPPCTSTSGGVFQPAGCSVYGAGGIDPYMQTPTAIEWNFTVEHQLSRNMAIRVSYVGSQAYHGAVAIPTNVIPSQICQAAGGCLVSDGKGGNLGAGAVAASGQLYIPPCSPNGGDPTTCTGIAPGFPAGTQAVLNPFLTAGSGTSASGGQIMYEANSNYHGGSISFTRRASQGLTVNASYTMSKAMEVAPELNGGPNDPGVLDAYRLNLSRGVASFNVLHAFQSNFTYELPFGKGKRFGGSAGGFQDQLIGGWQWNGIISAQSGFPFTPIAGLDNQNNGDSNGNDVASRNPAFTGAVYTDPRTNVNHSFFNPAAFVAPPPGTYGNIARGSYTGPGLVSVDTSIFKSFKVTERINLMFRTEIFNIINHANFSPPNETYTSGSITQTATKSRQIQFALKLVF